MYFYLSCRSGTSLESCLILITWWLKVHSSIGTRPSKHKLFGKNPGSLKDAESYPSQEHHKLAGYRLVTTSISQSVMLSRFWNDEMCQGGGLHQLGGRKSL